MLERAVPKRAAREADGKDGGKGDEGSARIVLERAVTDGSVVGVPDSFFDDGMALGSVIPKVHSKPEDAGSLPCVLRTFKLVGDALVGAPDVPLTWPATANDCVIAVAGEGEFDGRAGARLAPAVTSAGRALSMRCVAGNTEMAVLAAASGEVYYVGRPNALALAAAPAVAPVPYEAWNSDTVVSRVIMGPDANHVLLVTADNKLFAVGKGDAGQLGHNKTTDLKSPKEIDLPFPVASVSVASTRSAAVLSNGDVYTWGQDSGRGELAWENVRLSKRRGGARKKVPTKIDDVFAVGAAADKAVEVALGVEHMVVVTASGNVHVFGSEAQNQFGRVPVAGDDEASHHVLTPADFGGAKVLHVACGGWHTVVRTAGAGVWAFGSNTEGSLGIGDCAPRTAPVRVDLPTSVTGVACGLRHSVALADGCVYGWGRNAEGQLSGVGAEAAGNRIFVAARIIDFGVPLAWVGAGGHRTFALPRPDPLPSAVLAAATVVPGPSSVGVIVGAAAGAASRTCRAFSTLTGGLVSDTLVEYPGTRAGSSAAACYDVMNDVVWVVGRDARDDVPPILMLRFEHRGGPEAGETSGRPKDVDGRVLLADPRFALPAAVGATVKPFSAVVGLVAAVDALMTRSADTGVTVFGGAVDEDAGPGKKSKVRGGEPEIVTRYKRTVQGWSLNNSKDNLAFKVDTVVDLVGVGMYSSGEVHLVGRTWICEVSPSCCAAVCCAHAHHRCAGLEFDGRNVGRGEV